MRLTDLIRGDMESPEEEDPSKRKKASRERKEEEGSFRLSDSPVREALRKHLLEQDEEVPAPMEFPEQPAPPPDFERPRQPPPAEERAARLGLIEEPRPSPKMDAAEAMKAEHEALAKELIECVTQLFQQVSRGEGFTLQRLDSLVRRSLEVEGFLDYMYGKALGVKDTTNAMGIHLVNVFTLSLKLGRGLRFPPERQRRLGTAALIHDLGMCRVTQKLRHKEGTLAEREMEEIRHHPIYGYELVLENLGNDYRWLAETLLQEHEREGGAGYPQSLAGDKIGELAKVIGLADVYEALSQPRPHRKQLLPYKVVQEILQNMRGFFSPKVLKAMLTELSVFALHSLVRLNSNAIGKVVEIVSGHPLRPTIQLLYDADGYKVPDGRIIHLKDSPLLYIVDSVDESELPAG